MRKRPAPRREPVIYGEEVVGMPDADASKCVLCDMAFAVPDGHGGINWAATFATPDCEHETIDGRK